MIIDLVILSIALTQLMNIISRYIFIYASYQFFVEFAIDIHDTETMIEAIAIMESIP